MKRFFTEYGYSCLRMFIFQFAISIFGFSMAVAFGDAPKPAQYAVSFFAIAFYLVLIYSVPWNHGAKDRLSYDYGRVPKNNLRGFYMSLISNSINIILASVAAITFIANAKHIASVCMIASLWLQGMYAGIMSIRIGDVVLNDIWWMYLVIIIPAIVTSTVAYIAGFNNFRVFKFKDRRDY
jgi:hypothetical protein